MQDDEARRARAAGVAEASGLTLSERLRIETRTAHTAAERSGIMQPLLRGTIDRAAYVRLLECLAPLYETLESGLENHAARPSLAFIELPVLRRAARLRRDIATLRTPAMPAFVLPPSAQSYVEWLRTIGRTSPDLLLAHAYVRYLGDLSGGRILRGIVGKALQSGGEGLEFYQFPGIDDPDEFKRRFRDGLDAVELDASQRDRIVREALDSFARHQAMFTELA